MQNFFSIFVLIDLLLVHKFEISVVVTIIEKRPLFMIYPS